MNDSDQEPDLFTQALRADLPSERDEARVRSRLVAAGVLAGASLAAPSAAAATTGGFFSKLSALPLGLKIGASVAVVGVAALPVYEGVASLHEDAGARNGALAVASNAKPPAERAASQPNPSPVAPAAQPVLPALEASALEANGVAADARVAPVEPQRSARMPSRSVEPATPSVEPNTLPAVGAFPASEPAPLDEGTLRAETALMERALAALRRNDFTTARQELRAHAARFPNGHLKPERERALERTLEKEIEQ